MSISPRDLLSQARQLASSASTETEFRNVIGRAYYGAYHEADRFHSSLPASGTSPSKPLGVHAKLSHQLQHPRLSANDPKYRLSQNIGRHLEWLHQVRVKADYRLGETLGHTECAKVMSRVERVFEFCS